jgi:hypothetical protein
MAKLKCIILLPLERNDGSAVKDGELRVILRKFLTKFGGYTVAGEVEGGWSSPSGQEFHDRNTVVWVVIEPDQLPALRKLVVQIGRKLGQEAMYFEVTSGNVEILEVPGRRRKSGN